MVFSASYARAYFRRRATPRTILPGRRFLPCSVSAGMLFVSRHQLSALAQRVVHRARRSRCSFCCSCRFIGTAAQRREALDLGRGLSASSPRSWRRSPSFMTFAPLMSTYREKMQTFRYGILPFARHSWSSSAALSRSNGIFRASSSCLRSARP